MLGSGFFLEPWPAVAGALFGVAPAWADARRFVGVAGASPFLTAVETRRGVPGFEDSSGFGDIFLSGEREAVS